MMFKDAHTCSIYNISKLETTQMFINSRMNKEIKYSFFVVSAGSFYFTYKYRIQ